MDEIRDAFVATTLRAFEAWPKPIGIARHILLGQIVEQEINGHHLVRNLGQRIYAQFADMQRGHDFWIRLDGSWAWRFKPLWFAPKR
ncbi:MAG TPA: hypothetical protein DIT67_12725 [Octadecabacter sp.]|nr:hypothetical protein [Octadecabacter sp.]